MKMLTKRIVVKLLVEGQQLVKYRKFTERKRIAGDPVSTVGVLEDTKLDEFYICALNTISPDMVKSMTDKIYTPVTAAGSIHCIEQVDQLIKGSGVDKVVIKRLKLAEEVAKRYGSQAVIKAIDYHNECVEDVPDCYGEVILTSIDRDGMGTGFDLKALKRKWRIPVILAGGCGALFHVKEAFDAGADGVCISSMFFFSDKNPIKLRSWLISSGVNVRA